MKRKLVLTIGFAGALALSIGFAKDFQNTKVFAQTDGDQYKLVTKEEQDRRESKVVGKDITTVITVEEQNMVENSSAKQGFVAQENGTGFFFEKK